MFRLYDDDDVEEKEENLLVLSNHENCQKQPRNKKKNVDEFNNAEQVQNFLLEEIEKKRNTTCLISHSLIF